MRDILWRKNGVTRPGLDSRIADTIGNLALQHVKEFIFTAVNVERNLELRRPNSLDK